MLRFRRMPPPPPPPREAEELAPVAEDTATGTGALPLALPAATVLLWCVSGAYELLDLSVCPKNPCCAPLLG